MSKARDEYYKAVNDENTNIADISFLAVTYLSELEHENESLKRGTSEVGLLFYHEQQKNFKLEQQKAELIEFMRMVYKTNTAYYNRIVAEKCEELLNKYTGE